MAPETHESFLTEDILAELLRVRHLTDDQLLGELLAVIHADGGHFAALVGKRVATVVALLRISQWKTMEETF